MNGSSPVEVEPTCSFSVVTVCLNALRPLRNTINSIRSQVDATVEHVVVDGQSSDGTVEYLRNEDNAVSMWISEPDGGIYDAMNKGLRLCRNEWVIFLNAGDVFHDQKVLSDVKKTIRKSSSSPSVFYGSTLILSHRNSILSNIKPLKMTEANLNLFATRVVCHQSIFIRRNIAPFYSTQYRLKGELDWYYRILQAVPKDAFLRVERPIAVFKLGGEGDIHFVENMHERFLVLLRNNPPISTLCFVFFFAIPVFFRLRRIILGY